jgi:prepilin-type N-terminal cleavage/methylation domain-containing protein
MQDIRRQRGGYTILELVIVVAISGLLMVIAFPRAQLTLDRITVHAAAGDVHSILSTARSLALIGHAAVAVDVDSASGLLRVRRGSEILLTRNVGQAHGVRVTRTRDSLTYDPRGLGHGAANLSIVVRLRSATETVFVSRLGRIR